MKGFLVFIGLSIIVLLAGCGSYNAMQVPKTEPKNTSYCQRIDDMAVGLEPYMVKDKTALTFDGNLRKDEVMALQVSMIADGGTTYKVKKSGITAMDEFGNNYAPMDPAKAAERMERAFRHDKPMLYDDMKGRAMPDEVTASDKLDQHFVFFDMEPNKANSRRFTVMIPASSADGSKHKDFKITVDPMRAFMNPAEKWDSYDERGVSPCGVAPMKAEAAPNQEAAKKAEEAAARAEEAAKKAEEAAAKQQKAFEKQQEK